MSSRRRPPCRQPRDAFILLKTFDWKRLAGAPYGPFLRLVCLFFFTMENDGTWYTWVAEPLASEDGKPLLRVCNALSCRPFDKRALKEILERVDVWYDALFSRLIVNGSGGNKVYRKGEKQ